MTILQKSNIDIFNQLACLLESLCSETYQQRLEILHNNSVGQHVRHIVEFYQCLQKGYLSGFVNYDERDRNYLIESDKDFTLSLLDELSDNLMNQDEDQSLTLVSKLGDDGIVESKSSFYRELIYLIEHSIHHLAIIKIAVNQAFPEIFLPENFGVAHSTIQFRKTMQSV